MFCPLCEKVSRDTYHLLHTGTFDRQYVHATEPHASSFAALQLSAKDGCEFCKLLIRCVVDQVGEATVVALEASHKSISYSLDWYEATEGKPCIKGILFYFGYSDDVKQIKMFQSSFYVELLQRLAPHPNLLAQIIGRPIATNPASDESMTLVSAWISECTTAHKTCHKAFSTLLPTRVIDVGPSNGCQEPCLLVSEGRVGQYIALTHVWGGLLPIRTTHKTLHDFMSQIPMSSLPPTFKDSVKTTRLLGLQYLWIDSLCIIQDSIEDWEIECSKMADIYRNALVTIAAVDAANSLEGFLNQRPSSISSPPKCRLPCLTPQCCADAHFEAVQRFPDELVDQQGPLTLRAWCMQEKLLCPRVLYFGSKQMYWDCNTLTHLEAYGSATPHNNRYQGVDYPKVMHNEDVERLRSRIDLDYNPVWKRIVGEYTQRALTNPSDRLPALSGLAHDVQAITGYTYLAGIWKEQLPQGLFWVLKNPPPEGKAQLDAAVPYIAPSWSWASCLAPVSFVESLSSDLDIQILSAGTTLAGLDSCGRITAGSLHVLGKLKRAGVRYKEKSEIYELTYRSQHQSIYDFITDREIGRCSFDGAEGLVPALGSAEKGVPTEREVVCLAMTRASNRLTIMLLQPVSGGSEAQYRRVGLATVQDWDWFEDVRKEELVLV